MNLQVNPNTGGSQGFPYFWPRYMLMSWYVGRLYERGAPKRLHGLGSLEGLGRPWVRVMGS